MIATVLLACLPAHDAPIAVGSRRELFVDRTLIAGLEGGALLRTHEPEAREVVLVTDKPWEGNTCAYYVLFEDPDGIRLEVNHVPGKGVFADSAGFNPGEDYR